MKLGSLFDGSGGFPLAGVVNGFTPVWASEIESYPLKVTAARFPEMKQLGDVLNIDGSKIEPVDVITFGSPCQDLSVAGRQLGIHRGERSILFFEAIRIIKEMREATNGQYPRFALWENVPGAFSSNKGADFQAVLQALASIRENGVSIPQPKKWGSAGCVVGNGWSIAWRVYDAQYWGVPQRRKRIYLVTDFGSKRAGEILFECEGVSGDSAAGGEAGEGATADAERSAGGSCKSWCIKGNFVDRETRQNGIGWRDDVSYTLDATDRHAVAVDCRNLEAILELSSTLQAKSNGGHSLNYQNPVVYDARGNGDGGTSPTLTGDHQNRITDYTAICVGNGQLHQTNLGDKTGALNCMHDQQAIIHKADPPRKYIVRRLTPLECCRLQGFPDWWEDGVDGSDTARYKMWGNGIALPCAVDVLSRISRALRKG